MACCGGQRRRPQPQVAPVKPMGQMAVMQAQAKEGMTLVEYTGENSGETSWFGLVTGMQYRFGSRRKIGYVYDADVPGLLDVRKGRQVLFKLHTAPVAQAAPLSPAEAAMARLSGIESLQWKEEAIGLYEIAKQAPPGLPIVELGTARGYTAGLMAIATEGLGCPIVTIDNYEPMDKVPVHVGPDAVRQDLAALGLEVTAIKSDSRSVPDGITDVGLLYIDSTHTREHIMAEWAAWLPLIPVGGIVAGHDYGGNAAELKPAYDEMFKDNPAWQFLGLWGRNIAYKRLTAPEAVKPKRTRKAKQNADAA